MTNSQFLLPINFSFATTVELVEKHAIIRGRSGETKMNARDSFAERYAAMPEVELERLSLDVESLVPDAREALRQEMERRSLAVESVEWTAQPVSKMDTVGGWLLFYCVCTVIVMPIWMLGTLLQEPTLLSLFLLPLNVLQVGAGILLWRRNLKGLRWVRWAFLYFFCCAILLILLSLMTANPETIGGAIAGVMVGAIGNVLWWMYFRKSLRVHTIFGHNMEGFPGRHRS